MQKMISPVMLLALRENEAAMDVSRSGPGLERFVCSDTREAWLNQTEVETESCYTGHYRRHHQLTAFRSPVL